MYLYLWLKNWLESDEGQGLVEYALIIVLVSIMAILALQTLSGGINGAFEAINTTLGTRPS
jgi:pilus assembly protein Flp/PilA